ncbi:MAG TPA: DUF4115 domain-containing protein, partial [Gammaproteobacteria bacterium]|nr:DUF4115 domain-containing protein [Gammaproteobacteria bacterium]
PASDETAPRQLAAAPGGTAPPASDPVQLSRNSAAEPPAVSPTATRTVTVREALITNRETAPASAGRLVIRFSDESWVEIFDADGVRREFRLASAGSRTSVRGTPPFNVLLGYAEGASVTFDGQDYDISRYIRGDTARFLIGPDGLAKARPPERPSEAAESSAETESEATPIPSEAAASPPSGGAGNPGAN